MSESAAEPLGVLPSRLFGQRREIAKLALRVASAFTTLAVSTCAWSDELSADHAYFLTLQDENASIATSGLTDRFYVNGLRFAYTSGEGDVPMFVQKLGHEFLGDGVQRISFGFGQLIFSPDHNLAPPHSDEPYAGVLLGDVSLLQDHGNSRGIFDLQAGVAGPAALGRQVQNGFHRLIGVGPNTWCCNQIHDEPVVELTAQRIWRLPAFGSVNGIETDILPNVTAGVGNLRDYALAGATFRIGQGLNSDFGVALIRPGMTGGDAFTPVRPLNWYVFGGVDGQFVAHDMTLDGNTFGSNVSVPRNWLVGDFEGGAAVMFANWRVSYSQVFETHTFRGEAGGLHQFGSLALSGRF